MRKLTRTEANFENLLEAALLVEGHCSHAAHGCSCRGCEECEENFEMESNSNSTMDPGEEMAIRLAELAELYFGGEEKPDTDVPYGDDPRADDEEYDEEQEAMTSPVGTAIDILSRQKQIEVGSPEVKRLLNPAKKIIQDLTTNLSRGSYK